MIDLTKLTALDIKNLQIVLQQSEPNYVMVFIPGAQQYVRHSPFEFADVDVSTRFSSYLIPNLKIDKPFCTTSYGIFILSMIIKKKLKTKSVELVKGKEYKSTFDNNYAIAAYSLTGKIRHQGQDTCHSWGSQIYSSLLAFKESLNNFEADERLSFLMKSKDFTFLKKVPSESGYLTKPFPIEL